MNSSEMYSIIHWYLDNAQTDDPRLSSFYVALAQEWLFLLRIQLKKEQSELK